MIDKLKEKYLIFKARKGSPEAISEIFNAYHEKIYRFAYFRVSGPQEAEDLTADVFLQFQNHLSKGGNIKSISGLLFKMARNRIIDFYRAKRVENIPIYNIETAEQDFRLLENILMTDEPEKLEMRADILSVMKNLKHLKDEYREIILLHYINELSVKELAQALDKTENNVRVLIFRAISSLREIMNTPQK